MTGSNMRLRNCELPSCSFFFIPEEIKAMKQSGLKIFSMMHMRAQVSSLRFAMTGSYPRSVIAHRPYGISFFT